MSIGAYHQECRLAGAQSPMILIMDEESQEVHDHCSTCIDAHCVVDSTCKLTLCPAQCGAVMHACKQRDHEQVCRTVQVPCVNQTYGCPRTLRRGDMACHLEHCPASVVVCSAEWSRFPDRIFPHSSHDGEVTVVPVRESKGTPRTTLREALSHKTLDSNLVLQGQHKADPCSVHAFRCLRLFRRDEYASHVRNVHVEIQSHLNDGWLEHRCPLACYGCQYSVPRIYPTQPAGIIVYNHVLDCVAFKPHLPSPLLYIYHSNDAHQDELTTSTSASDASTPMNVTRAAHDPSTQPLESTYFDNDCGTLMDQCALPRSDASNTEEVPRESTLMNFPFEILIAIFRYLDSCSLMNLSLCSHKLRSACSCLLHNRGIVIRHWMRVQRNDRISWKIQDKIWQFTCAFTPVDRWASRVDTKMADHLLTCSFQTRVNDARYQKPVLLPCVGPCIHSEHFVPAMKRMYPQLPSEMPVANSKWTSYVLE